MITIRPERPEDVGAIRAINEAAFDGSAEADIVDALRFACPDVLSLVALSDETVVGHIFFSPVQVEAGLRILRKQDCPSVIVLGHPGFYPRFGFVPASRYGLTCQWEGVPDEAFMVLILDESAVAGVTGIARYRDEFAAAM